MRIKRLRFLPWIVILSRAFFHNKTVITAKSVESRLALYFFLFPRSLSAWSLNRKNYNKMRSEKAPCEASNTTEMKWSENSFLDCLEQQTACTQHIRQLMTHEIFMVLIDFSWGTATRADLAKVFFSRWLRSRAALLLMFPSEWSCLDRRPWTPIIN